MDTKVSEVKKAIETSLKSQPEFLKGRKLIDLEQKKENLSDISENVEFYLEIIDEKRYILYIYGAEYVTGMCYAIKKAIRKTGIEEPVVALKQILNQYMEIEI